MTFRSITGYYHGFDDTALDFSGGHYDPFAHVIDGSGSPNRATGPAEQFTEVLGLSDARTQELARQSSQTIDAVTQCGAVLARGAQDISREQGGMTMVSRAGQRGREDGRHWLPSQGVDPAPLAELNAECLGLLAARAADSLGIRSWMRADA